MKWTSPFQHFTLFFAFAFCIDFNVMAVSGSLFSDDENTALGFAPACVTVSN
jgi:hypothetical protein